MFPTDSFFFSNLVQNIALTILTQIGMDVNKMWEVNNVVRERIMSCPLFNHPLNLDNISELKDMFNDFIEECLKEVLNRIV